MSLRDKVIVITGASGGIGAALAHTVVQRGANVILVARREEALRDAARACARERIASYYASVGEDP